MVLNPLSGFSSQPTICERSVDVEAGLTAYYRQDLPGELEAPNGFSHHLLTYFLTENQRQVTQIEGYGEYDGRMSAGDFYLYPAGIAGYTSWDSADETLHLVVAPELLQRVAGEIGFAYPDRVEFLPTFKERDRQLESLVRLFLAEIHEDNFARALYLESLGSTLSIHLLRRYCNLAPIPLHNPEGLPPRKLALALEYIRAHLDSDLSLAKIAAQIGLSRSYFVSQFKRSMGVTPHQYVNQQRVEKAKQLLKNRWRSLAEIALECGFSSQSHLTKVFRQYAGTTPKTYRDRL